MDQARFVDFVIYSPEPNEFWGVLKDVIANRSVLLEVFDYSPSAHELERCFTKLSWAMAKYHDPKDDDFEGDAPPVLVVACRWVPRKALSVLGIACDAPRGKAWLFKVPLPGHAKAWIFCPGRDSDPRLPALSLVVEPHDTRVQSARIAGLLGAAEVSTILKRRFTELAMNQQIPPPRDGHWITYQEVIERGRAEGRAEGRVEGLAEGRDAILALARDLLSDVEVAELEKYPDLDQLRERRSAKLKRSLS